MSFSRWDKLTRKENWVLFPRLTSTERAAVFLALGLLAVDRTAAYVVVRATIDELLEKN